MHAELSEFATGVHGSVRVVASVSVLAERLPDDIGVFLARYQSVRVSLDERVSTDIVRSVREGAADLGRAVGPGRPERRCIPWPTAATTSAWRCARTIRWRGRSARASRTRWTDAAIGVRAGRDDGDDAASPGRAGRPLARVPRAGLGARRGMPHRRGRARAGGDAARGDRAATRRRRAWCSCRLPTRGRSGSSSSARVRKARCRRRRGCWSSTSLRRRRRNRSRLTRLGSRLTVVPSSMILAPCPHRLHRRRSRALRVRRQARRPRPAVHAVAQRAGRHRRPQDGRRAPQRGLPRRDLAERRVRAARRARPRRRLRPRAASRSRRSRPIAATSQRMPANHRAAALGAGQGLRLAAVPAARAARRSTLALVYFDIGRQQETVVRASAARRRAAARSSRRCASASSPGPSRSWRTARSATPRWRRCAFRTPTSAPASASWPKSVFKARAPRRAA